MRLHVVITDEEGNVFEGELASSAARRVAPARRSIKKTAKVTNGAETIDKFDFSLPTRAFMKRCASSSSGPKRFALLVGRLVKGQVGATVETAEIVKEWNAISGVMDGPYQTIYATRAKDAGWIDHAERGKVTLLKDWAQAAR